jgi:hypothetical protein
MLEKNQKIIVVSFKLSASLAKKLDAQVITDNYGMRGKSKWVREAIEELLSLPNAAEFVGLSGEVERENTVVSIRIPRELVLKVEQAILGVRKEYPTIEGVKSKIIRTAIMQRLLRS